MLEMSAGAFLFYSQTTARSMHSINNSLQSALINGFQSDLDNAMAEVCRKRAIPTGLPSCVPPKSQKLQRSRQTLNPPNAPRPPRPPRPPSHIGPQRPLRPLRPLRPQCPLIPPELDDEPLIASAKKLKAEPMSKLLFEVFEKEAKPKSEYAEAAETAETAEPAS